MNDAYYARNRACACARCRASGLMAAAVLITLGVLFLLDQFYRLRFDRTFPVLLIVIGVVMLLGRTASTEGHIQPYGLPGPPAASPQDPWASGRMPTATTPSLPPPAGTSPSGEQEQNDQQVKP